MKRYLMQDYVGHYRTVHTVSPNHSLYGAPSAENLRTGFFWGHVPGQSRKPGSVSAIPHKEYG